MDLNQLQSTDQGRAAIHECAHALVARHYGGIAFPTIRRNVGGDLITETEWVGSVGFYGRSLTSQQSRRVAIAGNLAELMADPSREEEELEDVMICSYWCEDGWSATDFEMADGWTSADFRVVYSLLKREWKTVLREADGLIRKCADDNFEGL